METRQSMKAWLKSIAFTTVVALAVGLLALGLCTNCGIYSKIAGYILIIITLLGTTVLLRYSVFTNYD